MIHLDVDTGGTKLSRLAVDGVDLFLITPCRCVAVLSVAAFQRLGAIPARVPLVIFAPKPPHSFQIVLAVEPALQTLDLNIRRIVGSLLRCNARFVLGAVLGVVLAQRLFVLGPPRFSRGICILPVRRIPLFCFLPGVLAMLFTVLGALCAYRSCILLTIALLIGGNAGFATAVLRALRFGLALLTPPHSHLSSVDFRTIASPSRVVNSIFYFSLSRGDGVKFFLCICGWPHKSPTNRQRGAWGSAIRN